MEETIAAADYADYQALLAYTPAQAECFLAAAIGIVIWNTAGFMCFNEDVLSLHKMAMFLSSNASAFLF